MNKIIAGASAAIIALTSVGATMAPAAAATYHHHTQPRFVQHGSYALYNGHRGYRAHHRGYRLYNGYWFPPAAFIGAAIGGAIVNGILRNTY
jgi:hypothetical protein